MPRGVPGPVVIPVKKRQNKRQPQKKNATSFTGDRPGPGRPRGVPNRFTGELKAAILDGVNGSNERGISGFVCDLATDIPTSAAALLGRLIPINLGGGLDLTLTVIHRDETAVEPRHSSAHEPAEADSKNDIS